MKRKTLDIIGMVSLIIGLAADFLSDWANEKEIDLLIDEKLQARNIKIQNPGDDTK